MVSHAFFLIFVGFLKFKFVSTSLCFSVCVCVEFYGPAQLRKVCSCVLILSIPMHAHKGTVYGIWQVCLWYVLATPDKIIHDRFYGRCQTEQWLAGRSQVNKFSRWFTVNISEPYLHPLTEPACYGQFLDLKWLLTRGNNADTVRRSDGSVDMPVLEELNSRTWEDGRGCGPTTRSPFGGKEIWFGNQTQRMLSFEDFHMLKYDTLY